MDKVKRQPDIVIAATGYHTGLETLLGQLDVLDERGVPTFQGAEQHPDYPGLWFTGMRPQLTGMFHMAGKIGGEVATAIAKSRQGETTPLLDQPGNMVQE